MNKKEVETYVFHSSQVCVDIALAPEYPGFVRKVLFRRDSFVEVEFVGFGIKDEAGYRFHCQFSCLEDGITCVEDYLKKPIDKWENFNRTGSYPQWIYSAPYMELISRGEYEIHRDIAENNVSLPEGVSFNLSSRQYVPQ
jgi:hypothetical protein